MGYPLGVARGVDWVNHFVQVLREGICRIQAKEILKRNFSWNELVWLREKWHVKSIWNPVKDPKWGMMKRISFQGCLIFTCGQFWKFFCPKTVIKMTLIPIWIIRNRKIDQIWRCQKILKCGMFWLEAQESFNYFHCNCDEIDCFDPTLFQFYQPWDCF